MAAQHLRYNDRQRLKKYNLARREYAKRWQHVDEMIRDVVVANVGSSFWAVHTKVVLIDGIYRTQLSRSIAKRADESVLASLMKSKPMAAIAKSAKLSRLDDTTIKSVPDSHGVLISSLKNAFDPTKEPKELRSFASKYLQFHAPATTPIFDNYANDAMPKYADRQPIRSRVDELAKRYPWDETIDRDYRWHALRFLALTEHLSSPGVTPTIKHVDQMLWMEVPEQ